MLLIKPIRPGEKATGREGPTLLVIPSIQEGLFG